MHGAPLFIVPSVTAGGAEVQLMLQLAGLRRRGLMPRLMVLSDRIEPQLLAAAGLPPEHEAVLGLPSHVLNKTFLRHCAGALGPAARFVAAQGCDPAVALLPPAHFFARLLKLRLLARRRPLRLFQYHHSLEHALAPADTAGKQVFAALNRLLARACDWEHWHISEQVREDVRKALPIRREAVLFNSCDMDSPGDMPTAKALLDPEPRGTAPYTILLPGRLHAVKGHGLLIEAFRRLVLSEGLAPGDARLVFAGDGPERDRIRQIVAEAGLEGRVALLGAVPHPVFLALYRLADLVVVPSLSEGFGNVAIEALARRCLLVASNAAGLRAVVRPNANALQFPAGDADALYLLLRDIWRRRDERLIDLDSAARDIRERFGMDAHLDRLLDLLNGSAASGDR